MVKHVGVYADLALKLHCRSLCVTCVVRLSAAGEASEGSTFEYMAPEHLLWYLDDRPVSVKGLPTHHQGLADVYALGMSLWWLLAGKDPLLRVLRYQGQNRPGEEIAFPALKLKQQLVSLKSPCVACVCYL